MKKILTSVLCLAAAAAVYGFFVMKERVSIASKDEIKQVGFFRSAKSILTCLQRRQLQAMW